MRREGRQVNVTSRNPSTAHPHYTFLTHPHRLLIVVKYVACRVGNGLPYGQWLPRSVTMCCVQYGDLCRTADVYETK